MRRTNATRDRSRREEDGTRRRESEPTEGTVPEEPLAALHRAGGNQAVQSFAGRERVDRAAGGDSSGGGGRVSDGGESLAKGLTADLCPRCLRRYRAGKPLDCEECESALDARAGEQAVESSTDGPAVQPKLEVSDPDDRYEREAERVAEAVMRDDVRASAERGGERAPEAVQRMCSACQERFRRGEPLNCEECEAELQRATDASGGEVDGDVAGKVRAARTGGRPLPDRTRSYFESRMGRDFGDVRVHTGAQADRAARSLNARAFTLGSDVVFRSGEYRPHTRSGKRLLAHELTHVVQQGGGEQQGRDTSDRTVGTTADAGADIRRVTGERLQRWKYGRTWANDGPGPSPLGMTVVPPDERDRVNRAMDIVERIAENPDRYSRCHTAFENHCTKADRDTLPKLVEEAEVWKDPGSGLGEQRPDTDHIAYSDKSYRIGIWTIAATMIHELAHMCGIDHDQDIDNEDAVARCGLPTVGDIPDAGDRSGDTEHEEDA